MWSENISLEISQRAENEMLREDLIWCYDARSAKTFTFITDPASESNHERSQEDNS
jgi:hypothetical protein